MLSNTKGVVMNTKKETNKNDDCQHDSYCEYSKNVCLETDFKDICRMKNTNIDEMPLLKKVKERVERDKEDS